MDERLSKIIKSIKKRKASLRQKYYPQAQSYATRDGREGAEDKLEADQPQTVTQCCTVVTVLRRRQRSTSLAAVTHHVSGHLQGVQAFK